MRLILQTKIILSLVIVQGIDNTCFSRIIDNLSNLSDTVQNLGWLMGAIAATVLLIFALFSIRKKTNKYTRSQIEKLKQNKKYIPGIFVELNQSKEILRYFVYGKKWKKRLIKEYNSIYDNFYGDILRDACQNTTACFHLKKGAKFNKIKRTINNAIKLHKSFRDGKEKLKEGFEKSQYLFEIIYYPYNEKLQNLKKYADAACSKYFILTGSAGNGKTNLLCSMSELLMNLKENVLFLNSRDIKKEPLEFIFDSLNLPAICMQYPDVYLRLVNIILLLKRKYFYVVIDAINENDDEGFNVQISKLINDIFKYSRVKIIVSCRNEYYHERFEKFLVDGVYTLAFVYDLKEQKYLENAKERIFKAYAKHFNYTGIIAPSVKTILSKQLLLLRIFFEVNENSNKNVLSICKYDIFQQYIKKVQDNSGEKVEELLDILSDCMLKQKQYDGISINNLKNAGIDFDTAKKIIDSSVLISEKLNSHENTIARTEEEVVYFVFDEMRDYCLARRIVLNNISANNVVDGPNIVTHLEKLKNNEVSCAEGVIYYAYIFFRTDSIVVKNGKTIELCERILDIYRIINEREQRSYWGRTSEREFKNLGLRMILTSGLPIMDFEVQYIQDCLLKAPYEDANVFFEVALQGTLYNDVINLDTYLNILFGLGDKDKICKVFGEIISDDMEESFYPEDFIIYHRHLIAKESDKAKQIQKVAELFLICFELRDSDMQNKLYDYFYGLSTHDKVQKEMFEKMKEACNMEGSHG